MKSVLNILILIVILSSNVFAQAVSSGYFVVPNPAMDQTVQEQLGNKIKAALSKAGVNATDGYFPMVTIVKYDETETIEISGMRKMYKAMGVVTIIMTFANTSTALATEQFDVNGVGVSQKVAQATAVKNINIPQKTVTDMMEKAKIGYDKALKDYSIGRLTAAKKLKASKDYESALETASEVPADSKDYKEAQKLVAEIEKLIDKDTKEQQLRKDKEDERNFELQKKQAELNRDVAIEREKTRQENIKANQNIQQSRLQVVERYYRAWQAYYSGR